MTVISILLPDLRGGGAERVSIDLARAFAGLGHEVEFALMSATGDFLPEVQREFSVVDLGAARARYGVLYIPAYLCDRRPDAVIAMMWPLTVVVPIAARIAKFQGPVLIGEHGVLSRQYERWGRAHNLMLRTSAAVGYRLATARVGVSDGVAADMAQLAWLDTSKVAAVYNPVRRLVAPEKGRIDEVEAAWDTAGPRILTVGALKSVKNHSLLLRSFARLNRPNARLMLVGQGQEEAMLRTLAVDLGIEDRVIFADFHTDPSPFYATADLFVMSSNHEGFGNVIVEALSFGVPVVSTDCPSGPAEILENGRWGRLVPVGDAQALSRAMDEALSSPVDREALRRRAADFAPEIAARKYLDLLGLA
jgi:glycosyltransferase involved in cell wall biosynthesis